MSVEAAEVLVPCANFSSALTYFTDQLGFKVKLIFPADDPALAVVQGGGLTLRLDRSAAGPAPLLRFTKRKSDHAGCDFSKMPSPEGIRIEWVDGTDINDEVIVPDIVSSFVLTRNNGGCSAGNESGFIEGRAGMLYRDLVPDRQGGGFICSHIRIPSGGPVPDYVHHHHVRFQMLYCFKGWVEVVYEDQGPPFRMKAGDCVLQPPHIRHRVLQCSPGLEVIEVSCPAQHYTIGDPGMELPTTVVRPDRLFSGQRFVWYQADQAQWKRMKTTANWEQSNTGLGIATATVGGAKVLRPLASGGDANTDLDLMVSTEFVFRFVLQGSVDLHYEGGLVSKERLSEGDAFVIPVGRSARLSNADPDTQILEVSLPSLD